ncbi:MAG: hypothetical protein AB2A00_28610 [Myxococcota bacterium]
MRRVCWTLVMALVLSAAYCPPVPPIPATLPPPPPLPAPPTEVVDEIAGEIVEDVTDPIIGPIAQAVADALVVALSEIFTAVEQMLWALLDALSHLRDFRGKRGLIWFNADPSNPLGLWRPGMPVAVGAPVVLSANDLVGRDGSPSTHPVVEPADLFSDVITEYNHFAGRASRPGTAQITFEGPVSDCVEVEVREATTAEVTDPMLHLGALIALGLGSGMAPFWPDVGTELVMAPRERLLLRPALRDESGVALYFHAADFDFGAQEEWVVNDWRMVGVVLTSGGRPGAERLLTLRHRGEELGRLTVRVGNPEDVVRLDVEATGIPERRYYWVHATALLPDDTVLWQAPLAWELDEGLERWDLLAEADPSLARTDLALVRYVGEMPERDETRTVRVRMGSLSAEVGLTIPGHPTTTSMRQAEEDTTQTSSGGCSGAGEIDGEVVPWPAVFIASLALLSAWRRRGGQRT